MACWIVHGKRMELNSDAVAHYKNAGVSIRPCPAPVTAKKPRPSPRTGTTGVGIQKFGTQQLKYVDDDPSKGVIEKDVGARTRLFFGGDATTPKTPFSARYQAQRPATIRTTAQLPTSPHAIPQFSDWELPTGVFSGLGFPEIGLPTWEDIFGANDKHGCECEACKNGTGQCSDKIPQCDAWDLLCEGSGGATVGVVGGTNWFFWIKIVLAVIGIGILLWLLRPLFGIVKNVSGVTKSAVTRVNGMK